jgi:hypothetical protein
LNFLSLVKSRNTWDYRRMTDVAYLRRSSDRKGDAESHEAQKAAVLDSGHSARRSSSSAISLSKVDRRGSTHRDLVQVHGDESIFSATPRERSTHRSRRCCCRVSRRGHVSGSRRDLADPTFTVSEPRKSVNSSPSGTPDRRFCSFIVATPRKSRGPSLLLLGNMGGP